MKALLRRAQANERLEKYDLALQGNFFFLCRMKVHMIAHLPLKRTFVVSTERWLVAVARDATATPPCSYQASHQAHTRALLLYLILVGFILTLTRHALLLILSLALSCRREGSARD